MRRANDRGQADMSGATVSEFLAYWRNEGEAYVRCGDYEWMAALVPGRRILEIGCGLGFGSAALAARGLDVLAIVALLSEIKQDWTGAEQLLEKLIKMQNELSPPATWQHWIRVLRCNGKPFEALQVSEKSLRLHPGDENLVMESQSLMDWIGTSTLVSGNKSVN